LAILAIRIGSTGRRVDGVSNATNQISVAVVRKPIIAKVSDPADPVIALDCRSALRSSPVFCPFWCHPLGTALRQDDVTGGYLVACHGSCPCRSPMRGRSGEIIGAITWIKWAPMLNAPGYRMAGGFVPNTTRRAVDMSNGASVAELANTDPLVGLL
jgi:hypothetical protein